MFDIGGWELLVIGALALIIVGPKDLPRMVRSVGQWVGKARGLAREFQTGMEQAARDADLEDVAKAAKTGMKTGDLGLKSVTDEVRSLGADTKSMLSNPVTDPPVNTPPRPPAPKPTPPEPAVETRAEPPVPPPSAAPAVEPRIDPPAPSRPPTVRGADRDADDDSFLDEFERGVRR